MNLTTSLTVLISPSLVVYSRGLKCAFPRAPTTLLQSMAAFSPCFFSPMQRKKAAIFHSTVRYSIRSTRAIATPLSAQSTVSMSVAFGQGGIFGPPGNCPRSKLVTVKT